jgi:hypothetical protein
MMRFWVVSAGIAVGAIVTLLSAAPSAQAQARNYRNDSTVVYYIDENGRRRTRVIVQRRSYLDGGTEVLPGERKFTDYAIPPGYSGIETVLGPGKGYDRQPFNGPFDVPNNPRYSW